MQLSLSAPDITDRERELVLQVLNSPTLSIGPFIERFEHMIAQYTGRRHGVAVANGTCGLHLCMKAAGIEEGDEVITTPFSFVASANCILYERARPAFVDIDPNTLNMDPARVQENIGPRTKAILPVHVFGQPCFMPELMEIAERHGLKVIEDACEALGAETDGRKAGAFGDYAVFSFYPNKQATTGEGAVVVTDDDKADELVRSLRNQGRDHAGTWLSHVRLGYNYRLDELSAALGVTQLERLEELLEKRDRVAQAYNERLRDVEGVRVPFISPRTTRMSWFVYVVQLLPNVDRDAVMAKLATEGVPTRPYFTPIHLQPFYRDMFGFAEGDFPITEAVARGVLALPFHGKMNDGEIDFACERLAAAVGSSIRS
ncbi:MAG: DegT/DnrJ/EryC1/StrS family aminotransferase [Chloroflexi bacterium]|nr:DegT/DnrJ/EryC1/StrS family aminotransferase [Chloroflexota bacterium]